jgi:toxin FitB
MSPNYLLDSNIVIYSTDPVHSFIPTLIQRLIPAVSAVSYVEVLGFSKITKAEEQEYLNIFAAAVIFPIEQATLEEAVRLRQKKKMSLGDSLVAATASLHRLPLVTRNKSDFTWVTGLQVLNPFDPADLSKIV